MTRNTLRVTPVKHMRGRSQELLRSCRSLKSEHKKRCGILYKYTGTYIVRARLDGIIKTQHGRQCLNVEIEDICWLFVLPVLHVNIHTLPHGNNKP